MKTTITATIDCAVKERILKIAKDDGEHLSTIINRLLKEYKNDK